MKRTMRLMALLLAVCLVAALTGCHFENENKEEPALDEAAEVQITAEDPADQQEEAAAEYTVEAGQNVESAPGEGITDSDEQETEEITITDDGENVEITINDEMGIGDE